MFDHKEFVKDWEDNISAERKNRVKTFLSADKDVKRYIYGRAHEAELLCRKVNIDGVIDDFIPSGTMWNGIGTVHVNEVPAEAYVVNAVICAHPVSAERNAYTAGLRNLIPFCDLYRVSDTVPPFDFVLDTRRDVMENSEKWKRLANAFYDKTSTATFNDIIKFRLTGDYNFLSEYSFLVEEQYFDECVQFGIDEVFVDAGGFDGFTSENFCTRCPQYKKVYFFEPVEESIDIARGKLSRFANIEYIAKGLSDANTRLCFDAGSGYSSAVVESGSFKIDVVKLDDVAQEKVTFIKMDLEGHELHALDGATRHIREDKPKLAITVYHNSSDFYNVYDKVMNICPDYKVFLRHYTEGWSETVMFFIPESVR